MKTVKQRQLPKFFRRLDAMNRIKWFGAVLSANVAVIVAASSMIIAAASLYFTIGAQKTDRFYKEVSIQPRPKMEGFPDDMSLSITNSGLGPAIVEQIDLVMDGKCQTSYEKKQEEWEQIYTQFMLKNYCLLYTSPSPRTRHDLV